MTKRYKLTIEYDGRDYFGWQRQEELPTVQEALENAAAKLDGAPVLVQGAGRTDRGVHATGQVAHMDLVTPRPIEKVADALNFHLRPHHIAVLKAEGVSDNFNARFDAIYRRYRYIIINRRADLTIDRGQAWRIPSKLDHDAMQRAAQHLIGEHDFSTFRDAECQAKSPVKSLDRISVSRYGETIEVTVGAISFLHRQVRSIVGSLVEIGRGAQSETWIKNILEARDRKACGPVAPPDGLFLESVEYGP
ncbi:MAG: tRNA pseudouridine(38-40) synthase TruA [Pseudomonadota bacterium]